MVVQGERRLRKRTHANHVRRVRPAMPLARAGDVHRPRLGKGSIPAVPPNRSRPYDASLLDCSWSLSIEARNRGGIVRIQDFLHCVLIQYFCVIPFTPPVRLEHLRAIQERHRGPDGKITDCDVQALLQEGKRYRSFILRTKQLSGGFKRPSGVLAPVFDEWFEILAA